MPSMSSRAKITLVAFGCLLAVVAVVYSRGWFAGGVERLPVAPVLDLSDHPIYKGYKFSRRENVIDFGTQPLWLPTSLISETIKRDTVLRQALAERGLEIRFHPFLKGADVNFFLGRGDMEVAIGGDMPALTAAATFDASIGALIQQGFCSIVAGRHMLLSDLKGKRVAFGFGSNAHYALLNALSSFGLHETEVRMIPLDVTEMPHALDQGKIDAFSAWEPTPSIALAKFEDQVIIHRSLCSGYLYFSHSFSKQHPEAVRQIVAAEWRALGWIKSRDKNFIKASRWAASAGQSFSGQASVLSERQYVTLAKSDLLGTSWVPAIPHSDIRAGGRLFKEFIFLKGLGKISDAAGWDKVKSRFDHTIVEEVRSAAARFQTRIYKYVDN